MDSQTPKRRYNSTRRKEQARQTRQQILDAAGALFFENGYSGTSMDSIAQAAGVAVETVYAAFGSKSGVLNALVDISIVGDDQPVALLQRENIQAAFQETDPQRLIHRFAWDILPIMQRMDPIFSLLRSTAKTEPEAAALLDRLLKERLQGMSFFIEQLRRVSPQAALQELPELAERAAETVWVLSSAEVFHQLTSDLGWSGEEYVRWLDALLTRVFLESPASRLSQDS